MTTHIVQIFYFPQEDAEWEILGMFDEKEHAQALVKRLMENPEYDGCTFAIISLPRNIALA